MYHILMQSNDYDLIIIILMKTHQNNENSSLRWTSLSSNWVWNLLNDLLNFALLSYAFLGHFDTFQGVGGWVEEIQIIDQLNPAKAETLRFFNWRRSPLNPNSCFFWLGYHTWFCFVRYANENNWTFDCILLPTKCTFYALFKVNWVSYIIRRNTQKKTNNKK